MDISDKATMQEEMARDIALKEHQAKVSQGGHTFSQCFDEFRGEEVVCCACNVFLSDERLKAQPLATHCVECQTKLEKQGVTKC